MSSLSGIGSGSANKYFLQQSLFNEIDTSGSGSIDKSKLEQAVTTAGGTTAAADALYAQLDPNNTGSVSEQQFSQNLPALPLSDQMGAQMMGFQADGWPGASATSPSQIVQSLFSQIDTGGTGSITKSQLEQAVTAAGGTTAGADALYAKLDPNNTGSVSEQQFAQALTPHHHHHHSDSDGGNSAGDALAQLVQADGVANGATSTTQAAENLFAQIDTGATGSITKSQLEQAVTAAGGTTAGADALYAKLDPNNTGSVSEQQFTQTLTQSSGHHHHHAGGAVGDNDAQDALASLIQANASAGSANSPAQFAQSLFSQIDTAGTGSITKAQLEQAVSATGGTSAAADALYAKLDPTNAGSVSEAQFAQYLAPPSASGDTAQDALLALLQANPQSTSASTASGSTSTTATSSTAAVGGATAQDALTALLAELNGANSGNRTSTSGNSALDALMALFNADSSIGGFGSSFQDPLLSMGGDSGANSFFGSSSGSSAQDALMALMQATNTGSTTGSSSSGNTNSLDFATAIALYQSQLNQQMLGSMFGSTTTSL